MTPEIGFLFPKLIKILKVPAAGYGANEKYHTSADEEFKLAEIIVQTYELELYIRL